jgi:hypothetical protein
VILIVEAIGRVLLNHACTMSRHDEAELAGSIAEGLCAPGFEKPCHLRPVRNLVLSIH